ncbi:MAG: FAD-binding oxidoreductase, partial [Thermodesulfobacteriota bacterium]|nr:FAD-binding oxidoreductase [Thermodesulfobacteriota bacterium]
MNRDLNSIIIKTLEKEIKGQVYSDNVSREKYSYDASIYRIRPLVIVCPRDADEVITVVKTANENNFPLTARAAGTNLTGSCLGEGIVLDFSRNMNRILELEEKEGRFFINVQPGVIYDQLNLFLKGDDLFLPPEPASREICMIGGNIALKASGARSVKYGSMDNYLEELEFVTADGVLVDTSRPETIPEGMRTGVIDLGNKIRGDHEVKEIFEAKSGIKTASGYNLSTFFKYHEPEKIISHLLVGSEGTLGIFTRLKLEVKKIVHGKATSLIYFKELPDAGDAVSCIKEMGASAIELMNATSLSLVKEQYPHLKIPGGEAHMLLVEFEGEARFEKTEELKKIIKKKGYHLSENIRSETEDEEKQAQLWEARKSLVPILSTYSKELKPAAFVEDIGVGVSNLADIIGDLVKISRKYDLVMGIYGHAGDGNLHLRPLINLDERESGKLLIKLMDEIYETVFKYRGTITAEHGVGRLRTNYLKKEWGEKIFGYMQEVKDIFDSRGILNPGVVFGEQRVTDNLKYPLDYISEEDR